MAAQIMSSDVLTQAIHLASDPTVSHQSRVEASSILDQVRSSVLTNNNSGGAIRPVINLLVSGSNDERVVFFALTIIQTFLQSEQPGAEADVQTRLDIRSVILGNLLGVSTSAGGSGVNGGNNGPAIPSSLAPSYVKTKLGVILALLVRADFMNNWNTVFDDLMKYLLIGQKQQLDPLDMVREEIYLRTLEAVCDEIVDSPSSACSDRCSAIKDVMRGYRLASDGSNIAPSASISGRIVDSILALLTRYRPLMSEATSSNGVNGNINGNDALNRHADQMAVLSLTVLKRYAPWIDLSLMVNDQTVVPLLFSCMASAGPGGDDVDATPRTELSVQAVGCLSEIVGRGMESNQKVALIAQLDLFRRLHDATQAGINISDVDATHVDAVIAIAELISKVGQELLLAWDEYLSNMGASCASANVDTMATLLRQLVALFFQCYAYDDIDVSGAVVPLASRLAVTLGTEKEGMNGSTNLSFTVSEHLPQLMTIMYKQMRYPNDFDFDYEDDNEAEEEQYRTSLRKLYQAIIRVDSDLALQFLCSILSGISPPLSSAPTADLEAALRLVYHYCEGIRPPPGLKTVMKNNTFGEVLIAIHKSDITSHTHREVLMLYYDLAVRYYPIFRDVPELLPPILGALSGACGLQHPHRRMRSRACYLLLKLIKAIPTVLRPYAETAVNGIQSLLANPAAFPIEPDDKLYLFEAIGLLLGKTGMEEMEQQRYLTAVMTPHIRSIEGVLSCSDARRDPDAYGRDLAASISAIAYLSKGFKNPCQEVQVVLLETVGICLRVLQALPENEEVRSKCMIYLQRMILCLGAQVLPSMPAFLDLLITHSTSSQDIVDVSHLLNQNCTKFKSDAIGAVDAALSPFLRKCYSLMPSIDEVVGQGDIPPHLLTEQLSIKKLSYAFLQHVVTYHVTPVFISSSNIGSFEQILQFMCDGAINVQDPTLKKSCVMFFRELIDQWAADGSMPSEHLSVQQGLVQFVSETVIPGLIKCMLDPSFKEKDAMQARNVVQVGKLLAVLREKRGAAEFEQSFITNVLMRAQCSSDVIATFRSAPDTPSMESAVREMLASMKGGQ